MYLNILVCSGVLADIWEMEEKWGKNSWNDFNLKLFLIRMLQICVSFVYLTIALNSNAFKNCHWDVKCVQSKIIKNTHWVRSRLDAILPVQQPEQCIWNLYWMKKAFSSALINEIKMKIPPTRMPALSISGIRIHTAAEFILRSLNALIKSVKMNCFVAIDVCNQYKKYFLQIENKI